MPTLRTQRPHQQVSHQNGQTPSSTSIACSLHLLHNLENHAANPRPFHIGLGHPLIDASIHSALPTPNETWHTLSDLLDNYGEKLDAHLAAITHQHGGNPAMAASFFAAWWASPLAYVAIGAYFTMRTLPDISPENVSLRPHTTGAFDGINLLSPSPLLNCPANSQETAFQQIAEELCSHMDPLLTALRSRASIGRRTLSGALANTCASAYRRIGRNTGDIFRAYQEANAFFDATSSFFTCRPQVTLTASPTGKFDVGLIKGTCCLSFKRAENSACTTCPLLETKRKVSLRSHRSFPSDGPPVSPESTTKSA